MKRNHVFLFISFLVLLCFSACAPQATGGDAFNIPGGTGQPDDSDLWTVDGTAAPLRSVVVVSAVELREGKYISTISLFVQDSIFQKEILVNGQRDGFDIGWDSTNKQVKITIQDNVQIAQAEIVFQSGSEKLATCQVAIDQQVNISGDCTW